jgi:hypothetical protein
MYTENKSEEKVTCFFVEVYVCYRNSYGDLRSEDFLILPFDSQTDNQKNINIDDLTLEFILLIDNIK